MATLLYPTNFLPPEGVKVDRDVDDLGQVTYQPGEPLPEWAVEVLRESKQMHYLWDHFSAKEA